MGNYTWAYLVLISIYIIIGVILVKFIIVLYNHNVSVYQIMFRLDFLGRSYMKIWNVLPVINIALSIGIICTHILICFNYIW